MSPVWHLILLGYIACCCAYHQLLRTMKTGGWKQTSNGQRGVRDYLPVCSTLSRARETITWSIFQCIEWANLQKQDKEKVGSISSIWESVLVRAKNPFPFPWDLWSGITQEALRWELYVWPGRAHDRAAWGGRGLWSENCCWVCCEPSFHAHKWIITWLPIFISREARIEEKRPDPNCL